MAYAVSILESAVRALATVPKAERETIRRRIDALGDDPRPAWARLLRGPERYWRFRVGDYRVVYRVADDSRSVTVVAVGRRGQIYRDR